MGNKKVDRFGHAGKDRYEKEAYKNFLASKFELDKTESEPSDSNKTNESTFEEENVENPKIKKRSVWLKTKDFLYDNWAIAFISGIILLILGGYIVIYREQGVQGLQISTVEKNLSEFSLKSQKNEDAFGSLKENFSIFKAEVSKDLEYIKKRLKL